MPYTKILHQKSHLREICGYKCTYYSTGTKVTFPLERINQGTTFVITKGTFGKLSVVAGNIHT